MEVTTVGGRRYRSGVLDYPDGAWTTLPPGQVEAVSWIPEDHAGGIRRPDSVWS